jgi:hypothetical protein
MTGRVGRRRKQLLFKWPKYYCCLSHKNRKDNFCGTKDQPYRSVTSLCTKTGQLPGLLMRSEFAFRVSLCRDFLKRAPRQPKKRWKNNNESGSMPSRAVHLIGATMSLGI